MPRRHCRAIMLRAGRAVRNPLRRCRKLAQPGSCFCKKHHTPGYAIRTEALEHLLPEGWELFEGTKLRNSVPVRGFANVYSELMLDERAPASPEDTPEPSAAPSEESLLGAEEGVSLPPAAEIPTEQPQERLGKLRERARKLRSHE